MRSRRRIVVLGATAAVAAAAWLVLRPAPVPAELGTVSRGALEVDVEGSGQTRVRERFDVLAPVQGNLERVELHAGDAVEAGQLAARVAPATPTPLDARARAELSARLAGARAAEAQARAT